MVRENNDFEVTLPVKPEPSAAVLKQVLWRYETAEEWRYETAEKHNFSHFRVFQVEDTQCNEREG